MINERSALQTSDLLFGPVPYECHYSLILFHKGKEKVEFWSLTAAYKSFQETVQALRKLE